MADKKRKPFILFRPFIFTGKWIAGVIYFWFVTILWEVIIRELILNKNHIRRFSLQLGLKNLFRYKKRTFITCIAIAVGIAIFIWTDAFIMGFEKDSDTNFILYETGSAQILDAKYVEEKDYLPLKYTIKTPDKLISFLKQNGIPATKRIVFGGEIFFRNGSKQATVYAIDPATNSDVFSLNTKKVLTETSVFIRAGMQETMIGEWLADDMGIHLGDTIDIRTRTRTGAFTTLTLNVTAIINTENPVINKAGIFVPYDVADEKLMMQGEATDVPVNLADWKKIEKETARVSSLIANDYPGLVVQSYIDLFGGGTIMESKRYVINVMLVLVFVIAAVGITNTMLMAVFERIKEIGMMRAMGMMDPGIRVTFLFEAGGIGVIGALIGLILGSLLNSYTYFIGIDFTGLMGRMEFGYRMLNIFRSTWNPQTMIIAFSVSILFAMIASFIPSSKALGMEVTDCLRYQ
ncbi:MAG: ABC transporter permease [Spirochaetales bacterium]|nr:ABC transporter permease [Spirochaetales bacterium]